LAGRACPACPQCTMVGFECQKLFCHTTFLCWPTFCPAFACLEHEMFTSEYKIDRYGPPEDIKDKPHNIQDGTNGVNVPKNEVRKWHTHDAFRPLSRPLLPRLNLSVRCAW
jgi:hypothetical protein